MIIHSSLSELIALGVIGLLVIMYGIVFILVKIDNLKNKRRGKNKK